MVTTGTRIEAALGRVDPTAEPRTDKVEIAPVKGPDCKERQDYGESSPQMSTGSCAIVGYVATQDVTVRTSDIKDAGTMVGLAGRSGAYDAAINSFDLRDPKPAQRQAIASALADAQAKATAIAAGSHLNLGPIITISNVGRVDALPMQEVVVTGSRRRIVNLESPPPPVPVNVTPQPISTTANVKVTYAIAR